MAAQVERDQAKLVRQLGLELALPGDARLKSGMTVDVVFQASPDPDS